MKCFVGLEVSSTKLDVCIMLSDTTTPFTASLPNDLVGASEIKKQILELNDSYSFERIVIGMEATSLYSFHPAMFFHEDSDLKALKVEVMVEQPNKIKKYRKPLKKVKMIPLMPSTLPIISVSSDSHLLFSRKRNTWRSST